MKIKKAALAVLCAVLLFVSGIVPDAFADWYDDISSGRYVEIKGNNYAVDTFYGVDALYNKSGSTYYCNDLVIRFYKEAYGLSVSAGTSGISMNTEGYKFVTPETPKAGDVVYVSASMRGGTSDHWAIVKSYNGSSLTLFEQNVKSGGQAIVDRQLKYPSKSYHLYTPVSTGDKPAPTLGGSKNEETTRPSTTESTTLTTTVTTTKPTTTTTKPVTTTTTTKPTTTKPTTTKPTTTKPTTTRVTTTKPTTTRPSTTMPTTTAPTTELLTTETTFAVTFLHIEVTENYWQYTTAQPTSAEENAESSKAPVVLGAACAVLAVGVAFLIFMIIKKR